MANIPHGFLPLCRQLYHRSLISRRLVSFVDAPQHEGARRMTFERRSHDKEVFLQCFRCPRRCRKTRKSPHRFRRIGCRLLGWKESLRQVKGSKGALRSTVTLIPKPTSNSSSWGPRTKGEKVDISAVTGLETGAEKDACASQFYYRI